MTIATVVTRGYGSFGTIPFVVTRGYGNYGPTASEAPANRTLIWKAQDRTWTWPTQDRLWTWHQQDRDFIWKAQDRLWTWPTQDRTLVWNQQDRSFVWAAQNRTYVWPLEVSDVTAKYPSIKDDGDITNWTQDFTAEMSALSDTISTAVWVLATGLTNVADSKTSNTASVKISGGVVGQKYDTTVTIVTTTSGETFERTVEITIGEVAA